MFKKFSWLILVAFLLSVFEPVLAMVDTASLSGSVWSDLKRVGAGGIHKAKALEGITVQLVGVGCRINVDCPIAVTDAQGTYGFSSLVPGFYTVTVSDGDKTTEIGTVELRAGAKAALGIVAGPTGFATAGVTGATATTAAGTAVTSTATTSAAAGTGTAAAGTGTAAAGTGTAAAGAGTAAGAGGAAAAGAGTAAGAGAAVGAGGAAAAGATAATAGALGGVGVAVGGVGAIGAVGVAAAAATANDSNNNDKPVISGQ